MGTETTPRDRLVAMVAVMKGGLATSEPDIDAAWEAGQAFVRALEAEPDKPVKCPCCTKEVTLCVKHYQLHEPGKKCSGCQGDE